jgi:hypothetical protein
MSTTPTALTTTTQVNFIQRLRNFLGAAAFLLVQRFPKLLQLHRNPKSWALFRVALGCFGAALVVLPLGLWNGWITAIFGLLLFVTSILLPPPEIESATDRKARELGARTVVSGGEYQPGNAPAAQAQLFLSAEHVWALGKDFDPLVVISTREITAIRVEPSGDNWVLHIRWAEHKAEFRFTGFFAERFALLAQDSIRGFAAPSAPEVPQRRAAGA